jgi:hypothetical protein
MPALNDFRHFSGQTSAPAARNPSTGIKNLAENRWGLAQFAQSSEEIVPDPFLSGFRIGYKCDRFTNRLQQFRQV